MRDFGDMGNLFLSQPCTAHPLSVRGRDKLMNRLLQGAWDGRGHSKTDNVCVYCRSICILLGTQSLRMPSWATTRGRAIAPPRNFHKRMYLYRAATTYIILTSRKYQLVAALMPSLLSGCNGNTF